MKFPLAAAAIALLVLTGSPALAASEPEPVAAEVKRAAAECRDMGGRPDTSAMLQVRDLNGDGGEDWLIHYAKLRCTGSTNPFCGSAGCTLQIYFWAGGSSWRSVFDDNVQKFRIVSHKGQPALSVTRAGSACGKPNYQSCTQTLLLLRDRVVPAR